MTTAYTEVAAVLREHILSGATQPGDRLPSEIDLANELKVSRATVREAMRLLASDGLIVSRRGITGGNFVMFPDADLLEEKLHKHLEVFAHSHLLDPSCLIEARIILEAPTAALAARHRTDDDLAALAEAIVDPRAATSIEEVWKANSVFHRQVFHASGNPLLQVLVAPLHAIVSERFRRRVASDEFWISVADEHRVILEAIRASDDVATEEAMASHLQRLSDAYRQMDADP